MCTAMEEIKKEYISQGISQGITQGISQGIDLGQFRTMVNLTEKNISQLNRQPKKQE